MGRRKNVKLGEPAWAEDYTAQRVRATSTRTTYHHDEHGYTYLDPRTYKAWGKPAAVRVRLAPGIEDVTPSKD